MSNPKQLNLANQLISSHPISNKKREELAKSQIINLIAISIR